MNAEDSNRLDKILKDILYKIPETLHVMIMDRDGNLISARSRWDAYSKTDLEKDFAKTVSAFTAPIFESAAIQGAFMDFGEVTTQLTEYSNKFMLLIGIGEEGVLNTFVEKSVSVQKLIKILEGYKKEIAYILTEQLHILKTPITKEIKALFYTEIGLKV
ncbi:MAG: roadblock/LC7 domain-containing protein [Promethearchaeota archaeon]